MPNKSKTLQHQWAARARTYLLLFTSLLLLVLLCSGCSVQLQPQAPHKEIQREVEVEQLSRWGELFSVSGETSHVRTSHFQFDPEDLIPQLAKAAGLPDQTNIIFQYSRGNFHYYKKPGEQFTIKELVSPFPATPVRYHLQELNEQFVVIQSVVDRTTSEADFAIQLPDREGVLYWLSLEAVDAQNTIIDTASYLIEVVPQEINAELALEQTVFSATQRIGTTLELMNYGPNVLYFGSNYIIERYEGGKWYTLAFADLNFDSRLYRIQPGEADTWYFRVPALLPEGTYRVVKAVEAQGVSSRLDRFEGVHLAVVFQVS